MIFHELTELANSGYGCYMGGVFAGAFGYTDDLKLLTPVCMLCIKWHIFVKIMPRYMILHLMLKKVRLLFIKFTM